MSATRDEMIRTAALNLLRIAEALEVSEPAEEKVEAPVTVTFKCQGEGCDHSISLDEINAKNQEFAGDVEVDPITAEDKIRCPECGKGVMEAVEGDVDQDDDADDDVGSDADDEDEDDGSEDQDLLDKAEKPAEPELTGHPAETAPVAIVAPVVAEPTPETVEVEETEEVPEVPEEAPEETEEEKLERSREAYMQAVRMASFHLDV